VSHAEVESKVCRCARDPLPAPWPASKSLGVTNATTQRGGLRRPAPCTIVVPPHRRTGASIIQGATQDDSGDPGPKATATERNNTSMD
jgi:hypothetical protein